MLDNSQLSELLRLIAAKDKSALESLWLQAKDSLYTFILSIIPDRHLAEDALQETYIAVYKSAAGFKRNINPRAWIYTIARNNAVSLLRKQKEKLFDSEEMPETPYDSDMETRAGQKESVHDLLCLLDETSKQIVILHAIGDLTHREIASVLNLPLGTVFRRYSQAIKKLRGSYSAKLIEEV